eukprot:s3037_g2.t1
MAVLRPSGWISSSLLQSACASDATAGITASSSVAPDGQNGVPLESDTGTEPESVEGDGSTSAIDFLDDLKPECPGHCELAHCSQSPRVQPGVEQHAAIDAFSRIGKLTSIQMPWEAPSVSATAAQGAKAVNIWTDVCVRFRHECGPGLAAKDVLEPVAFREAVFANVEACLGVKSPLTVLKRARSFAAWLRWRDAVLPDCGGRLSEANAWRYVAQLKDMQAAPTRFAAWLRWRDAVLPDCGGRLSEANAWRYVAQLKDMQAAPTRRYCGDCFPADASQFASASGGRTECFFSLLESYLPQQYGVSGRTQAVLGRHCKCASTADAVYARDLGVGPMRELQRINEAIAEGDVRPDEARSRCFRFPPQRPSPVSEVTENQCEAEEGVQTAAAELEEGEASEPEEANAWRYVAQLKDMQAAPTRPGTAATLASWLESNFGRATVGEHAAFKRLIFEGQTLILGELNSQGQAVSESLEPGHALLGLALVFAQSCSWCSYEKYVANCLVTLPGTRRTWRDVPYHSSPRLTDSAGFASSRWESVRASVLMAPIPP